MPATPPLPGREPVLRALADICGPDFARTARSVDAVAGRRVSFVAVPATARQVEDIIRLAAERGLATMARGSGSKIDWGTPPAGVDLLVDTGRLGGMWNHDVEARAAEAGAGTPVRALQAALALRGQRLAVDPPSRTATVGGMLAVNESGPLRHRFGAPEGQISEVAYVDFEGARRTASPAELSEVSGIIMSATLRLEPLPTARRWVTVAVSTPLQVYNLVDEALALELEPSAVEVDLPTPAPGRTGEQPTGSIVVLLEGDADGDVVDRSARLARALGGEVSGTAPAWWGRYPFGPKDVALRISVHIEDLHAAVYALRDAARGAVPIRGSAGVGTVHAVLPGSFEPERIEGIVDSVRSVLMARSGRAILVAAPPDLARQLDMAHRDELF